MFYSNALLCKKDDLRTITMENDSSGSVMCKHVYKGKDLFETIALILTLSHMRPVLNLVSVRHS